MNFYKDTNQISKPEKYEFKLPEFGKSTTDPTYYEPTATRIANMRKSASSGKSLFDFENGEKVDVTKVTTMFGRKPYMTNEEVAQEITQNKLRMENQIKNYDEEQEAEKKITEQLIKQSKAVKKGMESAEPGTTTQE